MENLLVIDILFSSMQVSEIREIVTYGWGNFLGMWDKVKLSPSCRVSGFYRLTTQLYDPSENP